MVLILATLFSERPLKTAQNFSLYIFLSLSWTSTLACNSFSLIYFSQSVICLLCSFSFKSAMTEIELSTVFNLFTSFLTASSAPSSQPSMAVPLPGSFSSIFDIYFFSAYSFFFNLSLKIATFIYCYASTYFLMISTPFLASSIAAYLSLSIDSPVQSLNSFIFCSMASFSADITSLI